MSNDFGKGKKRAGRRAAFLLAMLAVVLLMGIGWKIAKGEMKTERRITAYTAVTKWGQKPLCYQIAGQTLPKDVSAADFLISGEANGWGTTAMHPFSCSVSEIGSEGEDWYLVPADFPEKYFYVKKMAVQREKYPERIAGVLALCMGQSRPIASTMWNWSCWRTRKTQSGCFSSPKRGIQ